VKTVTYERSGRTNTGAQAVRVEGMRRLRVLEQGETVVERALTEDEVQRLGPLLEAAAGQPAPAVLEPVAGGPRGLAVSLAFEDEETPRVRLETHPGKAAKGEGTVYDTLLTELDELLTAELHEQAPRHAHTVLPHELRQQE
jgi:hypothetical protein